MKEKGETDEKDIKNKEKTVKEKTKEKLFVEYFTMYLQYTESNGKMSDEINGLIIWKNLRKPRKTAV
jgi:hypothetical protein